MNQKDTLRIFETPELLSEAAGDYFIELSNAAIKERGRFIISLSGGHTPEKLFSLLATPAYRDKIQWSKTFVFWGDERCVGLDDKQNNAHLARVLLLNEIDIPPKNIFPIPVNLPPAEAALEYEQTLKSFFGTNPPSFDLILLGLGENGHTASLFPGTPVLHEQTRWVKEVYVEEQKMFRVTMTAPLINQARNIVFLVSGSAKAVVLNTVLHGTYLPERFPAQLIKPASGNLYWFVDKEAGLLIVD